MMLLRLAWRNLWRNRRRSLIVLASIVVGVFMMDYAGSFSRGIMRQMLEIQLGISSGHLQVHAPGFLKNKVVDRFMPSGDAAEQVLRADRRVAGVTRRTVSFGLLTSASASAGVTIVGITPKTEAEVTTLHHFLVAGRWLSGASHEVVMGRRTAKTLGVTIGDRVVAMVSAADGTVGSELFRVVGFFQSPSSSFDKTTVCVPIADAQAMLHVDGRIAEVAAVVYVPDSARAVRDAAAQALGADHEVRTFYELLPSLTSQLELTEQVMAIFFVFIGAAMLFGVVNTLLMSVFERIRELGVLKSIGMNDRQVAAMILTEAALLGVLGSVIGLAVALSVNGVISRTGINLAAFSEGLSSWGMAAVVYPVISLSAALQEAGVVLAVCLLAAVAPVRRAMKLEPVEAIHHL